MESFVKEFKPKLFYEVQQYSNKEMTLKTKSAALIVLGDENTNEPMLQDSNLRPGFQLISKHTNNMQGN